MTESSKNTLQMFDSMYTIKVNVRRGKCCIKGIQKALCKCGDSYESRENVNVKKMLEQEICAVSLSLAMSDSTLRLAHNKADLGMILQQDLPQNSVPRSMPTCLSLMELP
jgi:hypothetical protein